MCADISDQLQFFKSSVQPACCKHTTTVIKIIKKIFKKKCFIKYQKIFQISFKIQILEN